jgi:hypothetical protein
MSTGKKAAIDVEQIADKPLGEISAAEFLSALQAGGITPTLGLHVWPEKKKVELWPDGENVSQVKVRDLIRVIVVEKKKRELEKMATFEQVIDPLGMQTFPSLQASMISAIAQEVEARLRRGG